MHPHLSQYPQTRVFCIGRNYVEHIRELGDEDAAQCIIFMKPATSLVEPGRRIQLPTDRGSIHHEAELVLRIGRQGSSIPRSAALDHIDGITMGLDLTLRDLQNELKSKGAPWERCKAFESSAPLGTFLDWKNTSPGAVDLQNLHIRCHVDDELRQDGNTRDMLYPVDQLIEILSIQWQLRAGDLVFTGTPSGVGPVVPGQTITVDSAATGRFAWSFC